MIHTPYVYIWKHIPTLKWYIGVRTQRGCHPDDGYICSSKTVKPMIITNPEQWTRQIIATGGVQEMLDLEVELLEASDAKYDIRSFNLHNGDGKFSMAGKIGGRAGKEPWNKGKRVGTIPWNKGLSQDEDDRVKKSNEARRLACIGREPWNKGLTSETDERVAKNVENFAHCQKGKIPWNKGLTKYTSESVADGGRKSGEKNKGREPWNKGMKGQYTQSPEANTKRSATLKGKKRPPEVGQKVSETKRLKREAKIQELLNKTIESSNNSSETRNLK